jgi:integrase
VQDAGAHAAALPVDDDADASVAPLTHSDQSAPSEAVVALLPFVPPMRPVAERPATLAAALAEVKNMAVLDPDAWRHVSTDFAMVAKVTGLTLECLPSAPCDLRPILRKVRHARHNMTLGRWNTIKSSVARVLKIVGWVDTDHLRSVALDVRWQAAVDCLPAQGQKGSFMPFARYCLARCIVPEDVTVTVIEDYRQWRTERTLSLDVVHLATIVRRIWTFLQQHHGDWPQAAIPRSRDPRYVSFLPEEFPLSFQAEVAAVIQNMTKIKPLDPRYTKKYARDTIANTRNTIFRAASVIAKGAGGPSAIQSLRDVVTPEPFSTIMNEHFERLGAEDQWAPSAKTTAVILNRVARICGSVTNQELDALTVLKSRVIPRRPGLSARSRDRTAQFQDPALFAAFTRLPQKLFKEADRLHEAGLHDRAGRLHARALQLAILLVHPLRRKNLSELNVERHFKRDKAGVITRFMIPGTETKNGRPIEGLIPAALTERLDLHIRVHRPVFENASASSYLWPGGNYGHVAPVTIARSIKHLVEAELGVDFNVHLIRHIAATLLLEDDPRNMPLAQQLLGHTEIKAIERAYGHARASAAQKLWGEKLEEIAAKSPDETKPAARTKWPRKGKDRSPPKDKSTA